MLRKLLFRNGIRVATTTFAALPLILMMSACGDDKATNPPAPALTMSVGCNNGLAALTVRNTGGPMNQASRFVVTCDDGYCDTLMLSLGANDSMSCELCNVHGDVTVTNAEWALEATAATCLSDHFELLVGDVSLQSLVPSPFFSHTYLGCAYSFDLQNLAAGQRTAELLPADNGLTLRCVFSNLTGNFSAPSPGGLCPGITGSITITSVVVTTEIDFGSGDDPQVTLEETEATINGLTVNVDGLFGWAVELIIGAMQDSFTNAIEEDLAAQINTQAPDLNALVIVNTACAE